MSTGWLPVYVTVAEFRARVRRAVDGVRSLPDWERELLACQWVEQHGDEETRWLVGHMLRDRQRWEELMRERAEFAEAEVADLRRLVAELLVENRRLRGGVA